MNYTRGLVDRTKELLGFRTQIELAEYFQVTGKQISAWRTGSAVLPYPKFIKIAKEYNVNMNWFFFGVGEKYLTSEEMRVLQERDIEDNKESILVRENLLEYEKQAIIAIMDYMPYAPRAFIDKVLDKLGEYKEHFKDISSFK